MGLDDIEWYESPTSDEEVLAAAKRINDPEQNHVSAWSRWGWIKRSIWCLLWIPTLCLTAILGLLALVLIFTMIGAWLGCIVFVYAGMPSSTLIHTAIRRVPLKD